MPEIKKALSNTNTTTNPRTVRLSVNLSAPVAEALKTLSERHQSTYTEEVRRAISMWKYLDEKLSQGDRVLIETPKGRIRELVIPS
jgi:hypothetical protein